MKTVIKMAEAAGFERIFKDAGDWVCFTDEIERFAEFVRADEREACAMLAEKLKWADNMGVASAIRARGNT